MRRLIIGLISLICLIGPISSPAEAQDTEKTRVLLLLDCSRSMWDRWQSDAKIKVTQKVLLHFLDSIAAQGNVEVAMRVFGHLNKGSYGTRLECPFEPDNIYKIQSKIKTLVPNGGCTAATALGSALHDFPPTGASRNIILIITDGMDDCDGTICDVARQVQLSDIVVQTFIVGIGNEFKHSLDCAGKFIRLPDEERYGTMLHDIFHQSEETARLVINLFDEEGMLYETEVPIVFYDAQTKVAKYNMIYSIDSRFTPDTLILDPLVAYDIDIFTRPPISFHNKTFSTEKTNNLNITVEQGTLRIRREERRTTLQVPQYPILVRQGGSSDLLNVQKIGETASYRTGLYDIDVLCTPPYHLKGVNIQKGAATELTIPLPGMLILEKPKTVTTGSIFSIVDGKMDWVCDLNPNSATERVMLMPGEYSVILKPQESAAYKSVKSKRFHIESGMQTTAVVGGQ